MQYFFSLILSLGTITGWCGELTPLKDGLDAYRIGQFRRAYLILEPWAEKGESQAQFTLALMYSAGQGVEINEQRAAHWFELAAAQGYRDAQFFLAQIYEQGWGINPAPNQAQEWYQRCAQQGDSRCQARLPQSDSPRSSIIPTTPLNQLTSDISPPAPEITNSLSDNSPRSVLPNSELPAGSGKIPAATPAINSPIAQPEFLGKDWLQNQNPTHYTLQILTSPIEQDLRAYVKKFNLQGDLAIISETRQGRIWYNLFYGSYPTANTANKARAVLPPEVKRNVWVRRFGKLSIVP